MVITKKIKIVFIVLFIFPIFSFAQSTINQNNKEKAKDLLSKILASRNKMQNIQFDVEYTNWQDKEEAIKHYNELVEKLNGITDIKKSQLKENVLKRGGATVYAGFSIALDNNGLEKRDFNKYGIVDSSGNIIPSTTLFSTQAWDGNNGIEYNYYDKEESHGNATLEASPPYLLKNQFQPWRSITGSFANGLAVAINEEKYPINVEELSDGKYKIRFYDSNVGNEYVGIIDSHKGYSCTLQSTVRDGIELGYLKAEYEEYANGVWIPVTAEDICKSANGSTTMKTSFKLKNIKVNDPNFAKDLFHIELPIGTEVSDKIFGIEYVVGDSLNTKVYPDGMTTNNLVISNLEHLNKVEENIFIPKVGYAIEKGESFVLSLSFNKLVNPKVIPESEESDELLNQLGEGDIAWDGKLIAVRKASVLTTRQNVNKPLISVSGKWSLSCELPEKIELPYYVIVVTKENLNYLLNIKKIESNGITVTFKKLDSDEINFYKPDSSK